MKMFLSKARSEEEFVDIAKKEGCEMVIVQPLLKARHFAKAAAIGISGFYQYVLKMSASTKAMNRKVIFKKPIFERNADETWNDEARQKSRIEALLLGEKKVEELRRQLPGATVTFMRLNGEIIDLEQVHADVVKHGVSIE